MRMSKGTREALLAWAFLYFIGLAAMGGSLLIAGLIGLLRGGG